jgi:hypothetical protein
MPKPHVVLRTHGGVPTPPPWAKWYRPIGSRPEAQFRPRPLEGIDEFVWDDGIETIIAVEWIA